MAILKQLQDSIVSLNNKVDELSQKQHDEKKKKTSKRSKRLESSDEYDSSDQSDQDTSKFKDLKRRYSKGRASTFAMSKPLDSDMHTWPTWVRHVERLFGICGCRPEDVEKIKDPDDKRAADGELMTILEIQAGPAFKKAIERLLECNEDYPGLAVWYDLSSQAESSPGISNMIYIKELIKFLSKALSRPIYTWTPQERAQFKVDLKSMASTMKSQQLTVEDIIVLTAYNVYQGHFGTNSMTNFKEMNVLQHYSYDYLVTLMQEGHLIEQQILQYAKQHNSTAASADYNGMDELQANVFRPRRFKQRLSQSNRSSQSHRLGGRRNPYTSKESCFRCGLWNHSAENCKYTTMKCSICNETGHKNTKCPQRNKSLHKESREHAKKRKRYQAKNHNKALNVTLGHDSYDSDDESCISMNLAGALRVCRVNTDPTKPNQKSEGIIMDSGCNLHVTPHLELLKNYKTINTMSMKDAQGESVHIVGKGTLELQLRTDSNRIIPMAITAYHAPDLDHTLISTMRLTKCGYSVHHEQNHHYMKTPHGEIIILQKQSNLPMLVPVRALTATALAIRATKGLDKTNRDWLELHLKLGHASKQRMASSLGISASHINYRCIDCKIANFERLPVTKGPHKPYANAPRQAATADVMGPFNVPGLPQRFRCAITYRDLYSDFAYVYYMRSTEEVVLTLDKFRKQWLKDTNNPHVTIRTDGATYFKGGSFASRIKDLKWTHQFSAPHSHATNPAEGINRVLMNGLRSHLKTASLGRKYWSFALSHTVHIRNRTASSRNVLSPYERHFGVAPDNSKFHIFGAPCVYKKFPVPPKLDDRGDIGYFLGYARNYTHGTYHVLTKKGKIIQSREVIVYDDAITENVRNRIETPDLDITTDEIQHWAYEDANKQIEGENFQVTPEATPKTRPLVDSQLQIVTPRPISNNSPQDSTNKNNSPQDSRNKTNSPQGSRNKTNSPQGSNGKDHSMADETPQDGARQASDKTSQDDVQTVTDKTSQDDAQHEPRIQISPRSLQQSIRTDPLAVGGTTREVKDTFGVRTTREAKDAFGVESLAVGGTTREVKDTFGVRTTREAKDAFGVESLAVGGTTREVKDTFGVRTTREAKDAFGVESLAVGGTTREVKDTFGVRTTREVKDAFGVESLAVGGTTREVKDTFGVRTTREAKDAFGVESLAVGGTTREANDAFGDRRNNVSKDNTTDIRMEDHNDSHSEPESGEDHILDNHNDSQSDSDTAQDLANNSQHSRDDRRRSKRVRKQVVPLNVDYSAKGAASKHRYYAQSLKRSRMEGKNDNNLADSKSVTLKQKEKVFLDKQLSALLIKIDTSRVGSKTHKIPVPKMKTCPYDDIEAPTTYKAMRQLPRAIQLLWIEAMNGECRNLARAGVLERVHLDTVPEGLSPMGTRWVFTKKPSPSNILKARVVVQGYDEKVENIYDIYSPTVNVVSIRVATIIALTKGYDAITVDVTAAFLEAHIPDDEFLYIRGIEGVELKEGYCFRLRKSLYGLKSAPRRWMDHLTAVLENYGLKRSITDASLFIGEDLLMTIHVDDMRIFGTPSAINSIVEELQANVGIKVNRDQKCHYLSDTHVYMKSRKTCTISQREYCKKALRRCKMDQCNPVKTPSILKELSVHTEDSVNENYRSLVGTLMYLHKTRPDMAYTLHQLASHGQKNGKEHMTALKHAFRYVQYTKALPLTLKGVKSVKDLELQVYTDASFNKKNDKLRRSVSGYVIMLNNSAVLWKTAKQATVAKSAYEAELIAAVAGVLYGEFIRQLLADMSIHIDVIQLFVDNQPLVKRVKKEDVNSESGYLAVQLAVLIHRRQNQTLKIHHVKGTDNIADLLTKPLALQSHWKHASRILNAIGPAKQFAGVY